MTGAWEPKRVDVRQPEATADIVRLLSEVGLVLLDSVLDADALVGVTRSIATVVPHRDSRSDGVTVLANRGETTARRGLAGFGRQELIPHTDRSSVECPPRLLMMACGQAAEWGGECLVVDGAAVYVDLAEHVPDAAEALASPRSALFGGAAGYLGSVFAAEPDGRVSVRLRLDDLARFSPHVARWRTTLRSTMNRHVRTISLDVGEGYVLNNSRWLHGRRAFTGRRVLYRVLADPLPHVPIPVGFRPPRGAAVCTSAG